MNVVGTINCPVCHRLIPVATMDDGALAFPTDPVRRHLDMHTVCVCRYIPVSGDRLPDPACLADHP